MKLYTLLSTGIPRKKHRRLRLSKRRRAGPRPFRFPIFTARLAIFVRQLEPETEADANALYVQALAVVGNIIGKNAFCLVRDSRHYPNLFVGIVGPTAGARKGTGGDSVQALGQEIDPEWFKQSIASGIASGEFIP